MDIAQALPLVSIIIPCYNAEQWIAEAINSALEQTYSPIEVIVINDGSTDNSLEVIKSFGSKIRWASGPNRGGNHARNRGFELSSGKYIQFLDADDYLLPPKIETQVNFLEKTGADVVYGDWRHKYHKKDNRESYGPITFSGKQDDVLEALLKGWWVAPIALLFSREVLIECGGWDESLQAGQDRDIFTSVAILGANIKYQAGCFSIYRRYGNVTVSTSNTARWLESHLIVLNKAETALERSEKLSSIYRQALAQSYFSLARNYYNVDRGKYRQILEKVMSLCPQFAPDGTILYRTIQRVCGFLVAEKLAHIKRQTMKYLSLI
jgi:glycosyltransferase involved in cell wall biosynthesis